MVWGGRHVHRATWKEHLLLFGEHNYCRAFVHNYIYSGQVRPPECLKHSAPRYYENDVAQPVKELEACDVPDCSPCMYGDGKGNLSPYSFKLPAYTGNVRETFRT